MTVWVVRAGQHGEFEEFTLNSNVVGIDFSLRQSIADFQDRDDLRQLLQSNNAADQLWRFAHELKIGETVVLPCKQPKKPLNNRHSGAGRNPQELCHDQVCIWRGFSGFRLSPE